MAKSDWNMDLFSKGRGEYLTYNGAFVGRFKYFRAGQRKDSFQEVSGRKLYPSRVLPSSLRRKVTSGNSAVQAVCFPKHERCVNRGRL